MKNSFFFTFLCFAGLAGCQADVAPNENVPALHERFHGKYKPINSVASEPVDVNFDGRSSNNLIHEIGDDLTSSDLEINIIDKGKHVEERTFLFTQTWPEQYVHAPFSTREPTAYDPNLIVNYARQPATRKFDFDRSIRIIQIRPDQKPIASDTVRFAPPEAVTVEGKGYIKVVNRKRLYTRDGWKTVRVETLYERYTMST
ncbi:hypothetical protein ACFSUS_26585 [Spirosoma soli]|uniref:Uncharacterized protein n=1 Tax=Spirosoma soli TaxID=1770529 RepID=A0ABW5MB61_9BACT